MCDRTRTRILWIRTIVSGSIVEHEKWQLIVEIWQLLEIDDCEGVVQQSPVRFHMHRNQ
jgi:hypothetical protein